jgi:hypothetical protein
MFLYLIWIDFTPSQYTCINPHEIHARLITRAFYIERGRRQPIGFFFVDFCHVPRCDAFTAIRTEQRALIHRKVNCPFDYPIVIHFDEVALSVLLVFCYIEFAMGAMNRQNVTALDFFAIGIRIYLHRQKPCVRRARLYGLAFLLRFFAAYPPLIRRLSAGSRSYSFIILSG